MSQIPNLGRLVLGCPTGAPTPIGALHGEIIAKVLALTNDGDFEAACAAAEAWGATSREARDDDAFWTLITQLVFEKYTDWQVKFLSAEDVASGYSPKDWYFELCRRASILRKAQRQLKYLQETLEEHTRALRKLKRRARQAIEWAHHPDNQFDVTGPAWEAAKKATKARDDLMYNVHDPLHPGVPLQQQIYDCRLLIAAARRALRAGPFDGKVLRVLDREFDQVFRRTKYSASYNAQSAPLLQGFVVPDDAPEWDDSDEEASNLFGGGSGS